MDTKPKTDHVVTVGRLRQLLANHHDSDRVLIKDVGGLLSNITVGVERSDIGHVVVLRANEVVAVSNE